MSSRNIALVPTVAYLSLPSSLQRSASPHPLPNGGLCFLKFPTMQSLNRISNPGDKNSKWFQPLCSQIGRNLPQKGFVFSFGFSWLLGTLATAFCPAFWPIRAERRMASAATCSKGGCSVSGHLSISPFPLIERRGKPPLYDLRGTRETSFINVASLTKTK